jgi:hypothetical protein
MAKELMYTPLLPDGIYEAEITAIDYVTGDYGEQVKFTFELHGAQAGVELAAWATKKLSAGSKLTKWVSSILGQDFDPEVSAVVDLDGLVGRGVKLIVQQAENTKQQVFNKVTGVKGDPNFKKTDPLLASVDAAALA